jgi:hypothetical protein
MLLGDGLVENTLPIPNRSQTTPQCGKELGKAFRVIRFLCSRRSGYILDSLFAAAASFGTAAEGAVSAGPACPTDIVVAPMANVLQLFCRRARGGKRSTREDERLWP